MERLANLFPSLTQTQSLSQRLIAQYGRIPAFVQSQFTVAERQARQTGRPLFVYLHSPEHDATDAFLTRTLSDEGLITYLGETCLSWAGDVCTADGFSAAKKLQATAFPFLALISAQGRVICRFEGGVLPPHTVQATCARALAVWAPVVQETKRRAQEVHVNRNIIATQDREYEEAMAADMERSRTLSEQNNHHVPLPRVEDDEGVNAPHSVFNPGGNESPSNLEEEEVESDHEAERKTQATKRQKECLARVPEEPPADAKEVIKVLFILPSGTHVQRRFFASDAVCCMHDFVGLHTLEDTDGMTIVNFSLVTSFPRTVVPRDADQTIKSLKLGRQIKLHVQEIVE